MLTAAFELHHLPNRAEMRLKPQNGQGHRLHAGARPRRRGQKLGAAMFFKDLTRVEQLEERERLRDRLAAVGEMAAVIAHEVKNPLAGIEVMAGLLRRKIPPTKDAQALLTDIIKEAKMANAIVQEVLDFVRPIRPAGRAPAVRGRAGAIHWPTKARRGAGHDVGRAARRLPQIQGDQHQLTQLFTNLLINAYEAMGGTGRIVVTGDGSTRAEADGGDGAATPCWSRSPTTARGCRRTSPRRCSTRSSPPRPQGSGLGLAIVRKIVDAHDGRLDLRPRRDRERPFV